MVLGRPCERGQRERKRAVRSFLRARFDHGEARFVGVFEKGVFCDWFGYGTTRGNGWKLENATDGGTAVAPGSGPIRAIECSHSLPAVVEIDTEFEVLPGEDDHALFALRFLPADGFVGRLRGTQPPLSLSPLTTGSLAVRLGSSGEPEVDKGCRAGLLAERIVPSPQGPPDAPRRIRLRAVFGDGHVALYLGTAPDPVLSEPCSAFGPDAMPNGGKLLFFGRGVRFRGFSFRKPSPPPPEKGGAVP